MLVPNITPLTYIMLEVSILLKTLCERYSFDIVNFHTQMNGPDCGQFLIACATKLVHGCDPNVCYWDEPLMKCLEEGKLQHFPVKKE